MTTTVAVLGAGSWGITLAALLHGQGCSVTLWEFNDAQAAALRQSRTLSFFPHLRLPDGIAITSASNTLTTAISGVTLTLLKAGSTTVLTTLMASP